MEQTIAQSRSDRRFRLAGALAFGCYIVLAVFTSVPRETMSRAVVLSQPRPADVVSMTAGQESGTDVSDRGPAASVASLPLSVTAPVSRAIPDEWWNLHTASATESAWWQRHQVLSGTATTLDNEVGSGRSATGHTVVAAASGFAVSMQDARAEWSQYEPSIETAVVAPEEAAVTRLQSEFRPRSAAVQLPPVQEQPAVSLAIAAADSDADSSPQGSRSPYQCEASDVAGWSGEHLDEARRALLQQAALQKLPAAENLESGPDGLVERVRSRGFTPGAPVYLRLYKDSSTLEVWMRKGERYALFQKYGICRWSGTFGPKLFEGDRQSPEGYYVIDEQLFERRSWKWKASLTINYPNAYDKLHGRTGSLILVHGGCTSSGCFAMTDKVIEEVRFLAELAHETGQGVLPVAVYPFPLTNANLARHSESPWRDFWLNLKEGYDLFETTRLPPQVRVCDMRYVFGSVDAAQNCSGLLDRIPGWRAAPIRSVRHFGAAIRTHAARGGSPSCNIARASCRKWAAMPGNAKSRSVRSARRNAMLKGAFAIGRRRK